MKLVVGLGNPGRRYAGTRHNVGFRVAEAFAERHGIRIRRSFRLRARLGRGSLAGEGSDLAEVAVLEPLTFMNRSGACVEAATRRLGGIDPACDLVVVYDDLDLPLGRIRVRATGGAGGHRGVEDVIDHLDTCDFVRLRFGIGRPPNGQSVTDWVLSEFSAAEATSLGESLGSACAAIELALREGAIAAMNRFNAG